MQIIQPHNKPSKKVEKWSEIKESVQELEKMVEQKNHGGRWAEALAISHCQVSDDPYRFFCVNSCLEEAFGHKTIINLRILDKDGPVAFKEACMSFPFRPEIKTKRFSKILVEFEYKSFFGLKTERRYLIDVAAIVAQHEYDHSIGVNIYDKFKR